MVMSLLRFDLRAPAFGKAKHADLYSAALEMAEYADQHGFDSVTVSEHHGVDDGFLPSPIVMVGALAACTSKARIGVSALLVPFYDPVKLAEDLVVLDLISRGRVSITAGMGYRREEYAMFGQDFAKRGALLDECLEVMLRAWRGEIFEYQGRVVQVTPRPYTDPHPPVLVGGQSKAGARRAARFGLPYQPATNNREHLQLYMDECKRLGVANPVVQPPGSGEAIWVSRDPDRTWQQIGPHVLHEATQYAGWQPANQQNSAVHSHAKTAEELRDEGLYRVLTPEECLLRAREGGARAAFMLYPMCAGISPDVAWESLELYCSEVLPQLRQS